MGITNIVISGSVELPANAFKGMKSLKSVAFTGTTTKIPTSAFQGCTGITFVNYGNVATIGESAFNGCTAYASLSYASKVTSVGKLAFYKCTKLGSVSLPSVKTIGVSAFSNCTALNKVDLGSNVTTIGDYAFNKCSKLTAITLPKTVTSIGTGAFQDCTNLMISGYAGSTAETYAWNNGKNFNYLDHTNVTSVSLQSLSVEQGKTATITATVSPSNAYKKTFKWSSNNTNVATVNGSGVVTAVGTGTATITAKSHNGQTATCQVTVTAPVLATGISLNKTSTSLQKGQSETLTATVTPSNTSNKAVTWGSNNTSVATVNNGTVTAVGAGTATITATTSNGISASCQVTVSQEVVEVTGISLNKTSASIAKGNSETLTATITPSNATNKAVTWSSSNTSVATVSGGTVTAVGFGTATITATTSNGISVTCQITVPQEVVEVTGISLNKTSASISKGSSETLTATITPSNATNKAVTWSSSNTSVATVSGGTVTAVGFGTATITATTSNGISATCKVTVPQEVVEVTGISLNKTSVSISKGSSETLTATITPSNATNKAVTWSSSNTSVATVSGGKVTAVSAGTATITAKSNNGKTATCKVTVTAPLEFEWGIDNWNFDNGDIKNYNVNDSVMNKMQADCGLSDYEMNLIKEEIKRDNEKGFGGSCFGMTVSEIMAKQGDLKLSRYGCNDIVNKNSNTSNPTSVINFIQELQGISTYNQLLREMTYMSGDYDQYDFIDKLENVLSNEDQWVKLSYGIRLLDKNTGKYYENGFHAVLAYGVESCNYYSSVTGKTYDRKVIVADPNFLSRNTVYNDSCLYYRSSDHSWIVPYWNQQNDKYSQLCYWNKGSNLSTATGIIRNIMKYDSLVDVTNLMSDYRVGHYIAGVEINNISQNETSVQQVKNTGNSNLDYSGSFGSGVARYDIEMDDSYILHENDELYALWNPTASYEVSYTEPSDYYAKMDYEGLVYLIDVKNSTYTLFKPSGYVDLRGNDASFDISILTEKSKCVTDWFSVGVSGNRTDYLTYKKTKDGYVLSAQNLNNVTVSAKNKYVEVSKTFSTDYDSVLIYEIDENTIGLKVDTDGNGTYETDITNQAALKNNSMLSTETINLGDSITVNAKASGGTGSYTYAVYYKQTSQSSWTTAQGYKANAKVTFTPAKAVVYDVCVKVKDSSGTEVKKYFTVTVTAGLQNKSVLSATEISLGESITAKCSATGGTGSYKYNVLYKQVSQSSWTTAQSYNSNASVTFTPGKATDYDVCVKVKDSAGKEVKKYFTVTVTAGLQNKSVLSETEIRLGDSVTVNAKASGGTGSYKYNILYKQVSQSSWTTVQSYSSNASVTFTPAKATDYDVCVKVKDSSGTVTKKYFTVTVMDSSALSNTSKLSATTISLGSSVLVKCSASGGTGFYQYAVYYKKTSESKWTVQQSYVSNASVSVKPSTATTYDICVKVKDSDGSESKKYFKVTVK